MRRMCANLKSRGCRYLNFVLFPRRPLATDSDIIITGRSGLDKEFYFSFLKENSTKGLNLCFFKFYMILNIFLVAKVLFFFQIV